MKNVFLLTILFFCCLQITSAQSGQLDPAFGNKGIVQTDIGARYDYNSLARQVLVNSAGSIFIILDGTFISRRFASGSIDSGYGIDGYSRSVPLGNAYAALQADGKIVVAGSYGDTSFGISRINTNGTPDSSFGKNGFKLCALNPRSVAIQSDGKIVVAGNVSNINNEAYFAVARYKSDGNPDDSFSDDGIQTTDFGFKLPPENPGGDSIEIHNAYANAVAIQEDGKIVVGGYVYTGIDNDFAIARYNIDGSLDDTFDNDGRQTSDIGSSDEIAYSLAIQSDKKIILAGYTFTGTDNNFAVIRYKSNGSLDNTFSGDGKVTADIGSDMQIGNSVAIQSTGKIVVAGYTLADSLNDFAVIRFKPDGTTDNTFGNNGKITTDFSASDDYAGLITIEGDDKIIVSGYSYIYASSGTRQHFALSRYSINGEPDSTFNGDGKLTGNYKQGNTAFNSTVIQNDGKIVAAGVTWNGSDYDFALARYNSNGSLDSTFGDGGKEITDFETEDDQATSIVLQKDGKIIVAGNSNSQFSVARYTKDGGLDNSFNGNGKLIIPMGFSDVLRSVALQGDGKIVLAGYTFVDANYDSAFFAITRLNGNGTLDNTFSGDGKQLTDFESSSSFAASVAIEKDGKIVVAGRSVINNRNNFSLARYNTNGSLDNTFSDDGKQNNVFGAGGYYGTSLVIQNDGKIVVAGFNETLGGITSSFAVARYKTNGDIDSAFGNNGSQVELLGPDFNFGYSVAVNSDGRIGVGGTNNDYAIVLYKDNGSLDSTFSNDGIQTTTIGTGKSSIQSIAFADHKLFAAGSGDFPGMLGVVAAYLLDNQTPVPPTITLTKPVNNASYLSGGNVYLTAIANDADGTISKVEFYSNATLLFTATDTPYAVKWQHVPKGNYTLTAKATDNSGLVSVSDTIHIIVADNKPPTVNIINPVNNQTFLKGATIHLQAVAEDTDGRISKVAFYNDSTLLWVEEKAPYTFDWRIGKAGNYTLTAKATDNWGAVTTSAAIQISVVPNQPPSVTILTPSNGQIFTAPATINISAVAQDADGRIVQVSFYNGAALLTNTEHKAPYTYQWQNVPAGTFSITAVAKDNWSAETTSATVTVIVAAPDKITASNGRSSAGIKTATANDNKVLQLLPNPAHNILTINTTGLQINKASTVSVVSASGAIMSTKQINNLMPTIQLNVSTLTSGLYRIKIVSGDKVIYKQFIKM